jgi:predicted signal transduction protein with EAL and GGDEF domain
VAAGVAGFPQVGANLTELLRVADEALYLAKQNGRNRVETSGGAATSCCDDAADEAVAVLGGVLAEAGSKAA